MQEDHEDFNRLIITEHECDLYGHEYLVIIDDEAHCLWCDSFIRLPPKKDKLQ